MPQQVPTDGFGPQRTVSRCQLLRIGGLGLMELSLPRVLRAEANSIHSLIRPRADACIAIFLTGGRATSRCGT